MPATRTFSGARLRSLRQQAGLRPEHVALAIGKSATAVLDFERGRVRPSLTTLEALANFYDCSLDELFPRNGALGDAA